MKYTIVIMEEWNPPPIPSDLPETCLYCGWHSTSATPKFPSVRRVQTGNADSGGGGGMGRFIDGALGVWSSTEDSDFIQIENYW